MVQTNKDWGSICQGLSVCARERLCSLFIFKEELQLCDVRITVRYARKITYCRQSLWDGSVSDITGRIPWKREISFLFILSGI